jgi:hypothetical protein
MNESRSGKIVGRFSRGFITEVRRPENSAETRLALHIVDETHYKAARSHNLEAISGGSEVE